MPITFPFKEENSPIFGKILRPIAYVFIKHRKENLWRRVSMIIDTGADYTLLPKFFASVLGIDLVSDCKKIVTQGVGGSKRVYLLKHTIRVKIGEFERSIPVGFLDSNYIPPLLGRHEFLETFRVIFDKFKTSFEEPK